jgi:hypothetical protein
VIGKGDRDGEERNNDMRKTREASDRTVARFVIKRSSDLENESTQNGKSGKIGFGLPAFDEARRRLYT